jgi:hypothetical protein
MAEEKSERQTLEMRVAAIEDKLAAFQITEQEMAAYQKVSSLMTGGQAAPAAAPTLSPIICVIPRYQPCIRYQPCWRFQPCICYECTCGPCIQQANSGFGSGFGGFGT